MSWRRPLTQAALLLMESLWAYALVGFFIALTVEGDRPTPLGVGAVVFLSFLVSRLLQGTTMSLTPLRIWGGALSLLLFYAVVRVDFFGDWRFWDFTWADALFNHTEATLEDKSNAVVAIPVLWLLWMRGIVKGQQSLIFEEIVNSFALGIVVMAVAALFAPAVHAPSSVANVAIPYIAIGLLTIGFAHASRSEKEFGRSFGPTWLVAVGGTVASTALIALLFVALDFDAIQNAIGDASLAATTSLVHFLAILSWPLEQLFYGLFKAMKFLVNLYGGDRNECDPGLPECRPAIEGLTEDERPDPGSETPAWLRLIARVFVGGSIAAFFLFVLAVLFGRFVRRGGAGEVKESTYQEGRLASDLGDMLGSLLGRLRPPTRSTPNEPMRRLYHEMLAAGADRGVERRPPETPHELSPRLGRTFRPEVTSKITNGFGDARYGAVAPPPSEVQRLREEWDRAKR